MRSFQFETSARPVRGPQRAPVLRLLGWFSGQGLVRLLSKYGYQVTRQTGSHMRLTSRIMGSDHHLTVPAHKNLKVGTLASILENVASYLKLSKDALAKELFER